MSGENDTDGEAKGDCVMVTGDCVMMSGDCVVVLGDCVMVPGDCVMATTRSLERVSTDMRDCEDCKLVVRRVGDDAKVFS